MNGDNLLALSDQRFICFHKGAHGRLRGEGQLSRFFDAGEKIFGVDNSIVDKTVRKIHRQRDHGNGVTIYFFFREVSCGIDYQSNFLHTCLLFSSAFEKQ